MDENSSCTTDQNGICQLDGNISCNDSETYSECHFSNHIEVIVGHRDSSKKTKKPVRIPCRKTIRRDNRGELSLYLPKHKYKIDEMLEMEDISYISTARPERRGGGCAITCDDKQFYMKEIKLSNPDNLEVTFATIRQNSVNSPKYVIILKEI